MQRIKPSDLINMADQAQKHGYRIESMYADAGHPFNMFGQAIYRHDAPLLLHQDFAPIVHLAAQYCRQRSSLHFVLHDGLRVTDAQENMQSTDIVKANPDWMENVPGRGRLLSPPGGGAHPRGMAIDISLSDEHGVTQDCGTKVDEMNALTSRKAVGLSETAKQNRALLDQCMSDAAKQLNKPLILLEAEWWDFRFPCDIYNQYTPISDHDLPGAMRLTR